MKTATYKAHIAEGQTRDIRIKLHKADMSRLENSLDKVKACQFYVREILGEVGGEAHHYTARQLFVPRREVREGELQAIYAFHAGLPEEINYSNVEAVIAQCYEHFEKWVTVDDKRRTKEQVEAENKAYAEREAQRLVWFEAKQKREREAMASRVKALAEDMANAGGVTVGRNEEKDGIEIKFAAKPEQGVIEALKEQGFRWHWKKKIWYARHSEQRQEFVDALARQ